MKPSEPKPLYLVTNGSSGVKKSPTKRVGAAKPTTLRLPMNTPTDKNHDIYFVPGLQRGLQVLEMVGRSEKALSITEIAHLMPLTRSSVFRLVYTLQFMGFLQPSADPKAFELGARVLNLGFSFLAKQDVIQTARRDLEALRDATGISTHLAIRDGQEVLFLDCIQARSGFLSNVNVGARVRAYASPIGWLMLSELSQRELLALFAKTNFEKFTPKTPKDVPELTQAISRAASDGFVFSRGIVEQGGCSVAAPVFNREGHVVAGIDISGPESAFDAKKADRFYIDAVRSTAAAISSKLGHVP